MKIYYKKSKNVEMAQKGQKQEGMLCGKIRAVCGLHTQGYCTISLHLVLRRVKDRHRVVAQSF